MHYVIQHATRLDYDTPVVETVMEVRKTPRDDARQQRLDHRLTVVPAARIFHYVDASGNLIQHFNVPQQHQTLLVVAESRVRVAAAPALPATLGPGAFDALDAGTGRGHHLEFLQPSRYATATDMLSALARELDVGRRSDPLATMRHISAALHRSITYTPSATSVDSSADEAIAARRGVCQDFAHLAIALARLCGIPCRYVSGYLATPRAVRDAPPEESHAWVEAWIPELDWVGFDPTHDAETGDRYVRVAVGRDYADVPPTRGVCKGRSSGRLTVGVRIWPADAVPDDRDPEAMLRRARSVAARDPAEPARTGDAEQ